MNPEDQLLHDLIFEFKRQHDRKITDMVRYRKAALEVCNALLDKMQAYEVLDRNYKKNKTELFGLQQELFKINQSRKTI